MNLLVFIFLQKTYEKIYKEFHIKLQLISDTHNSPYEINPLADLVVHAGDFSNGIKGVVLFAKKCREAEKDFVFVLGNNDYYQSDVEVTFDFVRQNFKRHALIDGNSLVKQGITFVGGTLFTNFRRNLIAEEDSYLFDKNKENAQLYVHDFSTICYGKKYSLITPSDYVTLFNKCYNKIMKYKDKPKTVVVTHFPPHECCLDPYWGSHPTASVLNPYFINNFSLKGFSLWLAGHTHTAVDTVQDGCRVVINPLGYPREQLEGNGFNPNLLIEV